MAKTGRLDHVINGQGPADRLRARGVTFTSWGENIYGSWHSMNGQACWNVEDFANQAVTWWMNSPGHRSNILNPIFNYTGVGIAAIARNGQGWFYTTQDFIRA